MATIVFLKRHFYQLRRIAGSSVLTAAQMLINSSRTSFAGRKYEKVNDKYTKFTWRDSRRLQTDSRNIDFSSKITNKNSKLPSLRSM